MVIEIPDVWASAVLAHNKYVANIVDGWIDAELSREVRELDSHLAVGFIKESRSEIIFGSFVEHSKLVQKYDVLFPECNSLGFRGDMRVRIGGIIAGALNYTKFSRALVGWNAYQLCSSAAYKVCPYCHINTTETVQETAEYDGYRPQLDHYICKSKYPFLSLSLGNLLPVCAQCNGPGMKHTKDFYAVRRLHPLVDRDSLKFKIQPLGNSDWTPLLRAMKKPASHYQIVIEYDKGNVSAENSVRTFQLSPRYAARIGDAYRAALAPKATGWRKSVLRLFGIQLDAKASLGFTPGSLDYKAVSCGKMMSDVYQEVSSW